MSPESASSALERLVGLLEQQLELLLDSADRPEVDRAKLSENVLALLISGAASHLEPLAKEDPRISRFVERAKAYGARTVDVRHHLLELAAGWSCATCDEEVPAGARISGVTAGAIRVELVCKACGRATKLAPPGERAFQRIFGHLVSPSWNPSANGFEWAGR